MRKAREAVGITKVAMAQMFGVARQTLLDIESGRGIPMARIAGLIESWSESIRADPRTEDIVLPIVASEWQRAPRPVTSVRDRFYAKVSRQESGCWLWTACENSSGYGMLGPKLAHRVSYELHHGPIGAGLFVCHRCDVKRCVNPEHLFLGTVQDNVNDMIAKGREASGSRNGNYKPGVIEAKRALAKARYKGQPNARLTAGSIGQLNPHAILTEAAVRDIRAKVAAGMSHGAAAYEYAVSPSTVRSIVTRRTWKHVD